ncbi:MAG TPA: hypothetical protein VJC07_04180 [Candidatus Nanoarchaeia archaeon]|nr:hypothetical protein [Candidatus Nanoarchaeia archaeon]
MRIGIIAERGTRQDVIEELIEDVPKAFRVELGIKLHDTKRRYDPSVTLQRVASWPLESIPPGRPNAGVLDHGKFVFNIMKPVTEIKPGGEDVRLFLAHGLYLALIEGPHFQTAARTGEIDDLINPRIGDSYSGTAYEVCCGGPVITLGIPNKASIANAKIAAHEIAHLLGKNLSGLLLKLALYGDDHCSNDAGDLRCLMNPPNFLSPETMEEVSLGFCRRCEDRIYPP